ncbi:FecCD family ABC transporter permease [Georgenia satyanarayanai]|uniref:FecCD family ABC transporter permease n=1 Tax=Georgenia satyanarayanai TaxID=860221 RepID=UPI0012649E7B|nr:iron ABC transporter permease [Georgenia satyanarayanai]
MTQTLTTRPARRQPDLTRRRLLALAAATVVLLVVLAASLALGARDIPLGTVVEALTNRVPSDNDHNVVLDQRLPRTVTGLLVGAALGLAGTVMQGVTRNPLADPGLLGINAGASLAVVLAITGLGITSPSGYVWFAFAGAAAAMVVVYGIGSTGRSGTTPVKLALVGTALTAGITSVLTLLLLGSTSATNTYRFWAVGSLAGRGSGTGADVVLTLLPFLAAGATLALLSGRALNLLSMGEDLARGLGLNIRRSRLFAVLAAVLLAGAATALAGPVVFIGLVVPHIVRPLTGPDYRWILAFAVVVGPALLLVADVIGRLVAPPGELEVGLVVALVGAPVMIAIVRRSRQAGL